MTNKQNLNNFYNMKIKSLLLSAMAIATAFVSCQKDGGLTNQPASVSLDVKELTFETPGTKTVSLTVNRNWEAEIPASATWLAVNPAKGEGSADAQTIEITVSGENTGNDRSATIAFRIVGGRAELKVTQKGDQGAIVEGDGTLERPYSIAQIYKLTKDGPIPTKEVYIKGVVTALTEFGGSYGNYTYDLSDDATRSNWYTIYRGYYIGGEKFTSAGQLNMGDVVVVYGQPVYYNNKTPEFTNGSKIITINGSDKPSAGFGVSATALSAQGSETSAKFSVSASSDVAWTAKTNNASYTCSPASGKGSADVTVNFPANTASSDVTVVITVSTDADVPVKSHEITLTHKAADAAGVVTVSADKEYLAANMNGNVGDTGVITYTNSTGKYDGSVTELRIYKGKVLSITATSGYTITEVILTCTAGENTKQGFYTTPSNLSVGAGATAVGTVADKVATISVTGNTSKVEYTATENQMRVTNMIVKYKAL